MIFVENVLCNMLCIYFLDCFFCFFLQLVSSSYLGRLLVVWWLLGHFCSDFEVHCLGWGFEVVAAPGAFWPRLGLRRLHCSVEHQLVAGGNWDKLSTFLVWFVVVVVVVFFGGLCLVFASPCLLFWPWCLSWSCWCFYSFSSWFLLSLLVLMFILLLMCVCFPSKSPPPPPLVLVVFVGLHLHAGVGGLCLFILAALGLHVEVVGFVFLFWLLK